MEPLEEAPAHEVARIDAEDPSGCRARLPNRPRQIEPDHDVIDNVGEGPIGLVIGAVEPLAGQRKPTRDQGQDTTVAKPADDGSGAVGSQA